jgi:hypothetical protein
MSLFRPGPTDKKRPLFNWAHWGVGMVAQLLASKLIRSHSSRMFLLCNSFEIFDIIYYYLNFHIIKIKRKLSIKYVYSSMIDWYIKHIN